MKVFNANSFIGKVQKSTKLVESSVPQLTITPTKDKFSLNSAAMALMGLTPEESRVMIIDMNLPVPGEPLNEEQLATSFEDRFFITVNNDEHPVKKGLISSRGDFAYSVAWGAMLLNQPNISMIKHEELEHRGLVSKSKSGSYIASKKIICDIEQFETTDENGEVQNMFQISEISDPQPVYKFVNVRELDHDTRAGVEEEDDVQVEDQD